MLVGARAKPRLIVPDRNEGSPSHVFGRHVIDINHGDEHRFLNEIYYGATCVVTQPKAPDRATKVRMV